MNDKRSTWIWVAVLLAGVWLAAGRPGPSTLSLPSLNSKVTQATYVVEAHDANIPSPVSAGMQKLNAQGIVATVFEYDNTDGTGEVPDQYKVAKGAVTKPDLPALVVQAGASVIRVVKNPKTEAEVLEAAQ